MTEQRKGVEVALPVMPRITFGPAGPDRGNPDRTPGKRERVLLREQAALELRLKGLTFAAIATELGFKHARSAHRCVERAMAREAEHGAAGREQYLTQALMRVERLIGALWERALLGDTKAVAEIRQLLERQSKYLGLDKPVRFEVTDAMDAEIEALVQDLAALEARTAGDSPAATPVVAGGSPADAEDSPVTP